MATKSGRQRQPSTRSPAPRDQTRTVMLIAAVVAVVAVIGVVVALVVGGGDDADDATATVPMSGLLAACSDDTASPTGGPSAPTGTIELAPFPDDDIYKPVAVEGEPLPRRSRRRSGPASADDPAIVPAAPRSWPATTTPATRSPSTRRPTGRRWSSCSPTGARTATPRSRCSTSGATPVACPTG